MRVCAKHKFALSCCLAQTKLYFTKKGLKKMLKSETINIRVNADFKEMVKLESRESNVSVSEILIASYTGYIIKVFNEAKEISAYLFEIAEGINKLSELAEYQEANVKRELNSIEGSVNNLCQYLSTLIME